MWDRSASEYLRGLGEDPPSRREITQRVNERCQ